MVIKYKDDGKTYLVFVEKVFFKTEICVMKTEENERIGPLLEHTVTTSTPKEILRYWFVFWPRYQLKELKRKVFKKGRK